MYRESHDRGRPNFLLELNLNYLIHVAMTTSSSLPAPGHTKRKHRASDADPDAPRKKKKEKLKQDTGKPRTKPSTSEFRVTKATITLSIPPVFASHLRAGAEEMLDSMIMRCDDTSLRQTFDTELNMEIYPVPVWCSLGSFKFTFPESNSEHKFRLSFRDL
jgi:hypothetical protein